MADDRVVLWGVTGVLTDGDSRIGGSAETMTQLKLLGNRVMTLVTDQTEAEATRAVVTIGVDRYLDLEVATYGHVDPAVALAKIESKYGAFSAVTLITHSTMDAAAASALGWHVVGISHDVDELYAAGAKAVFGDLSDIPAVVSAIQGQ